MRKCKTCFHQKVCPKSTHIENYRINECDDYKNESEFVKVIPGNWLLDIECSDNDEDGECNIKKTFTCSVCGKTENYPYPFCNCGAKMMEFRDI